MVRTKEEVADALHTEALRYSTELYGGVRPPEGRIELSSHDGMHLRKLMASGMFGILAAQNWLLDHLCAHPDCTVSDDGVLGGIPYPCDDDGDDQYPFCGSILCIDDDLWAIVEYVYTRSVEMNGSKPTAVRFDMPVTKVSIFRSEGAVRTAFFGFRMANTAWRLSVLEGFESDKGEAAA